MEVLVLGLIVVQIVRIAAERVQQTERVILERRFQLPVGGRMKYGGLANQKRRPCNRSRTSKETKQSKHPAHCFVLNFALPSCLESICSRSPRLRPNSGQSLNASCHVRLIGETNINSDPCQRR